MPKPGTRVAKPPAPVKVAPSPPPVEAATPKTALAVSDEQMIRRLAQRYPGEIITKATVHAIREYANAYGVPMEGLMLFQGRPYVVSEGLNFKVTEYCAKEGVKLVGVETGDPTEDGGKDCFTCRATVRVFDQTGFERALDKLPKDGRTTPEVIDALRSVYLRVWSMRSGASPVTVSSPKMHSRERLKDMAERRAVNRTKREVVQLAIATTEEIGVADDAPIKDAEAKALPSTSPAKVEPAKPGPSAPAPTVDAAEAIGDGRVTLLWTRWEQYIKARKPDLDKKALKALADEKLHALIGKMFQRKSVRELTVREFDRVVELLDRGRIEVK